MLHGRTLLVALALSLPAGLAQSQSAPPSPVGAQPAATTATYGDWVLRCETASAAAGTPPGAPPQVCEVAQTLQVEGKQVPAGQIAFGRPDHGPALHLIVALPVNVSFPSTVRVTVSDQDPKPTALDWKRCIPGACFADVAVGDDLLGRWRGASGPARLRYADAATREVVLPLSFRGLAQALDALGKR